MRHLLLPLLLVGCGVNEDNFAARFARLYCSQAEECYEDEFDEEYDDFGECLDDATAIMEDTQDYFEALCEIDYDLATECYSDAKAMDCDEIEEGQQPDACNRYVDCF
ncbi:MAG: hypothetical protein ABIO70_10145 [Pseudomonadota bacterium]